MSLPVDLVRTFDASIRGQLSRLGALAQGGFTVDTAGNAVQATLVAQPTYDRYAIAAGPGLQFGGHGAPLFSEPTYVAQASFPFQLPGSYSCLSQCDGTATVFELSSNASSSIGMRLRSDTSPTLTITGPGGTGVWNAAAGWFTDNKPALVEVKSDGTLVGTTLWKSGVQIALSSSGVSPGIVTANVPATWGCAHGVAEPMTGAGGFFASVPGRITTSLETTSILAYLNAVGWYIPPQGQPLSRTIISIGDSISAAYLTVGPFVSPSYAYPAMAQSILGSRVGGAVANNFGVPGAVMSGISTQWSGSGAAAATAAAGTKIIVCVQGGINDIAVLSPATLAACQTTAAAIMTSWSILLATIATALSGISSGGNGNHVIAVHTITKFPSTPSPLAARWLFNILLRQQYRSFARTGVDMVLSDLGDDAVLGNIISPVFQMSPAFEISDGQHPRKPGHMHGGGVLARALLGAGV